MCCRWRLFTEKDSYFKHGVVERSFHATMYVVLDPHREEFLCHLNGTGLSSRNWSKALTRARETAKWDSWVMIGLRAQ